MWDWVILAFVIYTTIEIPFDVAFVRPRQDTVSTARFGSLMALSPIAIANLIVDLFFIIDIPINFRSATVDKNTEEVISDPKKIAIVYLKSWFAVDFIAAIPFEFLVDPQHERVSRHVLTKLYFWDCSGACICQFFRRAYLNLFTEHQLRGKSSYEQVAYQAGAYPGFLSMKRLPVYLLPLDGMLVHYRAITQH